MVAEAHNAVAPLVEPAMRVSDASSADQKQPSDDAGLVEYSPPDYWEGSRLPEWSQRLLTELFVFVIVHYTFWFVPALAAVAWLASNGYAWVAALALACYVPSFVNDAHKTAHGRQWEAFRLLRVWNLIPRNYLGMKVLREAPLDETKSKKYIFSYHPHGLLVMSRFALFGGNWDTLFPNVDFRFLGASPIFSVPLCREASLWLGAVDASRATAERVLKSGKSVAVFPGGIREMFCVDPESKENALVLKNRSGFIKLAMRQGAELVPVMVFNEKHLYSVWRPRPHVFDFFRKLMIPLVAFWGRCLWMPHRPPSGKTFGMVFGKPIAVEHTANPSDEQVQTVLELYISELERLFSQHKKAFGCDDDEELVVL